MTLNQLVDALLFLKDTQDPQKEEYHELWYDLISAVVAFYEMREGLELEGYPLTAQKIDTLLWTTPTIVENMYENDLENYTTWIKLLREMLRFVLTDNGFGFSKLYLNEVFFPLLSPSAVERALAENSHDLIETVNHLLHPFRISKAFDAELINHSDFIWNK